MLQNDTDVTGTHHVLTYTNIDPSKDKPFVTVYADHDISGAGDDPGSFSMMDPTVGGTARFSMEGRKDERGEES